MEIHQITYFLAVARSGRFTQAAKDCHVSQPSLSIQIAKLEEELGGVLFDRNRRGVRLTPRGETFLPRAQSIADQLKSARTDMEELAGYTKGQVSLGCLPTTGAHVLPPILSAFKRTFPAIRVQLWEESSPSLAKSLEKGDIELAILDEAGLTPALEHSPLLKEDILLALPARHPSASKRSGLSLKQVAEEPFVLMKSGHGFRRIILDLFEKAGLKPNVVFESDGIETVQALVAAGLGISLVPRMVAKFPGIEYVRLTYPQASRTLSIAWRRTVPLSPAGEAMKKTALEAMKRWRG